MSRRAGVFALFYLSGIAGLIYQVLWLRRLSVVFGVTVYAASTVLAAFMMGLAIGSALSSRVLRRGIPPLAAFGVAEILIGATGLLSPILLDAASSLYIVLYRLAPESLSVLTFARLVSSFAILALPTTMMGVTLPLLTEAVSRQRDSAATNVSWLYALNTLGAMSGTLLSGLILIPAIGIQRSFALAAALNVAVGVIAMLLSRVADLGIQNADVRSRPDSEINVKSEIRNLRLIGLVVAVSGFASLALEIVWFRLMLQFVVATTEAFTAMLTTVLGGIALGGMVAATILRSRRDHSMALGITQALTGVVVVGSMSFLLWTVKHGWETMELWRAVLIAILPPSLCIGVGFPLALGMAARATAADEVGDASAGLARRIGRLYSLNVAGAIVGSLLGGFLLVPRAGSLNSMIALGALFLVSGLGVLVSRRGVRRWAPAALLAAAFFFIARDLPDPFHVAIDRRYGNLLLEFWRDEGAQTAVSVRASQFQHVLYLDGLHQANDQPSMVALHRAIGHLPMVLHGAPKDALVVGMGGGATPGAVSQYAGVKVQVVELSDSVRKAAPFFSHVNYDLLNNPDVNIRIDDGRNFLSLTNRRFDVITADIIQPGHAGAGFVYSKEYFTLVRNALKEDGVVLQWIGLRPFVEYTLIMRTFLDVFPNATLWYDANFMVGTLKPLSIDPGALDRLRHDPKTREALDAVGLKTLDDLRSRFTAGPEQMRAFVGDGPLLTDDRPLVEYHHWLPRPEEQPPLDVSPLKGDVNRFIAGAPSIVR
ncbi:MAG TPA: fused MFS/spermidine synthase [Vicinamibacterales bacterium]|nr:fused MFS/spermidine synthase [Vicinamibacterales bacterium]